jgi:hypothetical protein
MSNLKVNTIEAAAGNSILSNSWIRCNTIPVQPNDLANKQYVDSILTSSNIGVQAVYVDTQDQYYASLADAKFMDKANNITETVSGIKTFNKLPKCTLVPAGSEDLTNKAYVDEMTAYSIAQANAFTTNAVVQYQISSIGPFLKLQLPQSATGSLASFTDPVAPFLTAVYVPSVDGADGGATIIQGINGISVTGSADEETYNKVIEIGGTPSVTSVTEIVNRVIIDGSQMVPVLIKFNGTLNTSQAVGAGDRYINKSRGVDRVEQLTTGTYKIWFTKQFGDTNYVVTGSAGSGVGNEVDAFEVYEYNTQWVTVRTSGSAGGSPADLPYVNVAIHAF